jgi:hypothetical protein
MAKQVMGTPHYMAPEQWEKPLTVDHRADIYAMGVVFYELLTGELPLGRFAPPSHKVAVDVRLDDVVLRSLEKEPDRRYQHASQVKDEVAGITSTPGGAPPPIPTQPTRNRSASHKWLIAGSIVGCLLLLLIPGSLLAFVFMARGDHAATESLGAAAAADAQEVTAREFRLASMGLVATRESLAIDASTAEKLGVPAERVAVLNRDLQHVWTSYLHWEADGVVLTWIGADIVRVESVPGHSRPDDLMERAETAISRATERSNERNSPYQTLVRFVEKQMRFAPGDWVKFEVSIHDSQATVNRFEYRGQSTPQIVESAFEIPASAAAQRIWNRAILERDAPPK